MSDQNNQPSTAQLLELVNVQMASEAFMGLKNTIVNTASADDEKIILDVDMLKSGNEHSTKFTSVTASQFVQNWEVKAHQANTTTGFSGTLFEAKQDIAGTDIKKGDQVISFRSTEFIEDTLHDNRATNTSKTIQLAI
ncbi:MULTISPECIES: hypothetical protein [unclassified Moraxella]|uniref:hypothetical protein n=1 Tax=unclassified Moraxella TaxID=2685852 RepID=UPI003AF6ADF1